MKPRPLNKSEIESLTTILEGWQNDGDKIRKVFIFEDFIQAFGFSTRVALISESMGHHPELKITYSRVTIELSTHDIGALSNLDIKLAQAINDLNGNTKLTTI